MEQNDAIEALEKIAETGVLGFDEFENCLVTQKNYNKIRTALEKAQEDRKAVRGLSRALQQYTKVVSSEMNPNSFSPTVKNEGHYARKALTTHAEAIKRSEGDG